MKYRKKNSIADLQNKTLRKASRLGMPWETDEVARLVQGIKNDETTYEIALATGRSYYGIQTARSHVRFALNHIEALK
jgi:hypothetical protein